MRTRFCRATHAGRLKRVCPFWGAAERLTLHVTIESIDSRTSSNRRGASFRTRTCAHGRGEARQHGLPPLGLLHTSWRWCARSGMCSQAPHFCSAEGRRVTCGAARHPRSDGPTQAWPHLLHTSMASPAPHKHGLTCSTKSGKRAQYAMSMAGASKATGSRGAHAGRSELTPDAAAAFSAQRTPSTVTHARSTRCMGRPAHVSRWGGRAGSVRAGGTARGRQVHEKQPCARCGRPGDCTACCCCTKFRACRELNGTVSFSGLPGSNRHTKCKCSWKTRWCMAVCTPRLHTSLCFVAVLGRQQSHA